jgi:putative spermidine/putrescine transport system substrate-binding protein
LRHCERRPEATAFAARDRLAAGAIRAGPYRVRPNCPSARHAGNLGLKRRPSGYLLFTAVKQGLPALRRCGAGQGGRSGTPMDMRGFEMTASRFKADLVELAAERFAVGEIDRRSFLAALAALGAAPMVLRPSPAGAAADEIVVVNFGGDAVPTWSAAWGEPFTKDTGIKVSVIGGEPTPGAIKAMVESGTVSWDTTDGDAFYLPILGQQGLIQKYDYSKVDKAKVRPEFVFEYGCAAYLYSTVNGYNVEKTGGKVPNGYKDYLNFKDFPGKRAIYKWLVGALEAVLIGGGVEPDKLYPLDVDKAFALLKEHKDEFVMWGGGAASQQLFRDGEVVMGCIWSTRASVLERDSGGKLTWVWENGVVAPGVLQVLVNNPAGEKVFDFIASTQDPKRQIELLKLLGNGPANPAAGALLSDDLKKIDCGYEENYKKQIPINTQWYAENYDRVQNDFLDLMAG